MAEASRKLDVATKSLRTWIAHFERGELKASLGASKLTADQQRIRELECELAIAKMERDILKNGALCQGVEVTAARRKQVRSCVEILGTNLLHSADKARYGLSSTPLGTWRHYNSPPSRAQLAR